MRIGIDCRLWNESGVGRYVRNLVEQLQIIDHKNKYVLFVGRKDREEILRSAQNDNFSIVKADIRWHTLEEQLKFPSIINKENLDLMHFPYFSVPVFYNKPYLVTIHDLILNHFPTGLASTLPSFLYNLKLLGYKFVIKKAAQNARKIITVSNATKSEIVDNLKVDTSKVVVTYEGVDDEIRSRLNRDEIRNGFGKLTILNLPKDKSKIINTKTSADKYFLYVGNAYPHKNLERLLEAFSTFCHPELVSGSQSNRDSDLRQNDTKLVLVGKEDYFYKRLKEKVRKMHLEKSVLFYGEVSDEELSELYKNALALVMPSLMEGFGLTGLEAMANKCLVLSSDIPSLREVYGNAAVYFDPYDVKDLVRKMEVILGDSGSSTRMTKRDKIEEGFKRVKMFSWEKMARETLKIYDSSVRSESW
jgi:glycosyltransferase involved in cell wall biosynthesis